ncbi:carbohydrate-binding family 9-like protein [Arenibacter sp. GZD96]|uniref:carbohydrate-binding family 9-like protein n=1 Tax=Aurantibrevibacter litoralis TaxID=3106030 RepID=UPI002AFFA696|nr:carbohydrate-binding family 9-like protein [Arenibacter sp. GZD-96]MEA1784825.1 carbohydrate-binding family 9-like protein [Arenibacter sp. GZD-96]
MTNTAVMFCLNQLCLFSVTLFCVLSFQKTTSQKAPKKYIAYKTLDSIKIDGKASELSWQKAAYTDLFIDIEGVKKPVFDTRIKMVWDTQNLYFLADLKESDVWGTLKQRDTVIFYNNDFEIFIDPDGDTHNYYEIEINSLNTIWDLFLTKPYRNNGKVLNHWNANGLKSAIYVDGTLNNATDKDTGWTLEVAIPWNAITEAAHNHDISENDFWRINFSRVNWQFDLKNGTYERKKELQSNTYLPEYNWVWSPQGVINMHEPEHWGYVYFSNHTVGNPVMFEIPKDEHIKWYLYEIYRSYLKSGIPKPNLKIKKTEIMGALIIPKLEVSKFGWVLSVKSPFTNTILTIKEDGKFETHKSPK